ncbi:MAG: hypothetical protein HYV65_01030 [Candidatus Spechtbacteria bacterium]|nr:hypothetical protein [Candidatus Spechtbacteria bacterium]
MIILNLLPQEYQARIRRDANLRMFALVFVSLSVWTFVFFFLVAQGWTYLSIQNSALQQHLSVEENTDAAKKIAALEKNVKGINSALTYANNISLQPSYNAAALMSVIETIIPSGVTLNIFDLDSLNRTLTIGGIAAKREDVLSFEQNLRSQSQIIHDINAPITNLLKPENVQFSFFITLQSTQ